MGTTRDVFREFYFLIGKFLFPRLDEYSTDLSVSAKVTPGAAAAVVWMPQAHHRCLPGSGGSPLPLAQLKLVSNCQLTVDRPQCQLQVCETATMITLYKRETQASIFLCILCIRTYNKANMTNKHNQQIKHVRSWRARLTDSLTGPTHARPQQQLKTDLVRTCYSNVTLPPSRKRCIVRAC